ASLFPNARVGLSGTYGHPFSRAKVAVNNDIRVLRSGLGSRTVISDVLRGSMNVTYSLAVALSGDIQITQSLDFSASYSMLNSWVHSTPETCVPIATGCAPVQTVDNPTRFRASNWLVLSLDYDLTDEVVLSAGYYNLASQTGLDAQLRDPLWSP